MYDFIVSINGNISQIMPKSMERGAYSGLHLLGYQEVFPERTCILTALKPSVV
jgi:hypothetical protein